MWDAFCLPKNRNKEKKKKKNSKKTKQQKAIQLFRIIGLEICCTCNNIYSSHVLR